MQTFNQALEAVESYSPAEEQFNRRRRTMGLALGPIVLVTLLGWGLNMALGTRPTS